MLSRDCANLQEQMLRVAVPPCFGLDAKTASRRVGSPQQLFVLCLGHGTPVWGSTPDWRELSKQH